MTRTNLYEGTLSVGLVVSFAFVIAGIWRAVSLVWASSFTQTLEVFVLAPFVTVWLLAPLFWAVRPRGDLQQDAGESGESPVLVGSAILVVSVAVVIYTYDLLLLPFAFDAQPGVPSLIRILSIPILQWVIMASAKALQVVLPQASATESEP